MTLGDLVTGAPFVCGPEVTLAEVSSGMAERGHGSAGVIDGRSLVGVITERDVVRAIASRADPAVEPVRGWMSTEPDTFEPAVDVFDAAEWLVASGYRHLPVVDGDELLGIVSLRDLLTAILSSVEEE